MKENILAYIIGLTLIALMVISGWYIKREWNSYFFYDDATSEMVCKMVKPEYLKEGVCP